jgi:hypothetical protein
LLSTINTPDFLPFCFLPVFQTGNAPQPRFFLLAAQAKHRFIVSPTFSKPHVQPEHRIQHHKVEQRLLLYHCRVRIIGRLQDREMLFNKQPFGCCVCTQLLFPFPMLPHPESLNKIRGRIADVPFIQASLL